MIDATTIALMKKMISKYGGGSGSSADISGAIKQYLKDNPITAESIGAETTENAKTEHDALNKLIEKLDTDKCDKSVLYDVLHNTPHAETVGDFFDLRRTGKIYRTRFYTFAKNPTCEGTKLLDNAGLQYEPSTDTVEGKDDYLNGEHPLFEWYNCNYKRNADGTAYPTAIEGEDGYTTTGNVDVGVIQPSFYYNFETNAEEGYIDVTISDMPHTLRTDIVLYPWNECLQADGTVLPWCIGSKYISSIGDDGLLRSLPDRQPEENTSYETMITDYQKKGAGYWGAGAERNTFQIIFILIKGATKNSQSLFTGCTDYEVGVSVSIKTTEESVYVTTSEDVSGLVIGTPVYVAHRGSDGGIAVDIAPTKVIKIETIDNNNTAIYLDVKNKDFISTVELDSDESKYLVNMLWYSGTTDNVIGKHDGSMISNANGKCPYRVQGREYSVGGYMIASNTVMIFKSDYSKDVYVAPKGVKHTITEVDIKKNYTLIGNIPVNSNEGKFDYWVGDIDIKNGVWYPCSQGSGNSQGFADFVYTGGNSTFGTREYIQGGCLYDASNAGFAFLNCGGRLDYVYLNYCAAD